MTDAKLSLLHVAGWDFAPVPNRNAVVFRMHYAEETTEQPDRDRKYVLTAAQAEALRDALDAVLRDLETQQERSVKESAPN
jgi:BssS protein family